MENFRVLSDAINQIICIAYFIKVTQQSFYKKLKTKAKNPKYTLPALVILAINHVTPTPQAAYDKFEATISMGSNLIVPLTSCIFRLSMRSFIFLDHSNLLKK